MQNTLDISNNDDAKVAIINTIYSALIVLMNNTRESTEKITLSVCGIIIVIVGWYISGNGDKTIALRLYFSIGPLLLGIFGCLVVLALQRRYLEFANAINRINLAQQTQKGSVYLAGEALFPDAWVHNVTNNLAADGIEKSFEPTFRISIAALIAIAVFCAGTVWFV